MNSETVCKWKGTINDACITLLLPNPIPTSGSHDITIKVKVGPLPKFPIKTKVHFSTKDTDGVTMHAYYNDHDVVLWCDYLSHNKIEGEYLINSLSKQGPFCLERKI